jgi:hypothetical protein
VLIPLHVNTQNVRQRFWDGQDKAIRDDITKIKGNHLITFGGQYQRNFDYHQRTDDGGGIMKVAATPNSIPLTSLPTSSAAANPIRTPVMTSDIHSPRTSRSTLARVAPNAIRSPI